MKLKRKISKTEYENLTEAQQGLYIESDGSYVLDIDDTAFETLKAEKKAKEDELAKYKADEEKRLKEAEERAEKRAEEKYKKAMEDKNVEEIEKAWQEKYSKLEQSNKELQTKYTDYVKDTLISTTVKNMADEISTSPVLISPHIRGRLAVDMSGDKPKVVVTNENGEYSALTLDELKQTFIDNPEFSAIIKKSSSSGAKGTQQPQGNGVQPENTQPKNPLEMTSEELMNTFGGNADED